MSPNMTPLPQYQCHKKVWALKIKAIEIIRPTIADLEETLSSESEVPVEVLPSGEIVPQGVDLEAFGAVITPESPRFDPFPVGLSYVRKHNPKVGGYWVQYEDGYESFSPAEAFESGYTLIA